MTSSKRERMGRTERLVVLRQCYLRSFYRRIEAAYIYANRRLLTLMLRGQGLLPYLRSMKHFFFLDQSEFLNQFLDTAGSELRKPVQSASMTKIQSLLYMAVSNPASASSLDPHKESLKVTFNKESLFDYLIRITSTATSANQLNELARGLGTGQAKKEDNKSKKDLLGESVFRGFPAQCGSTRNHPHPPLLL